MSWLYTLVFAGLMLSSQEAPVAETGPVLPAEPVVQEVVMTDETEKFEQTYVLAANGTVNVSNLNGSITIEAWDRSEVKLEYTKTAATRERLADVEVRIDSTPERFSVNADYRNSMRLGGGDWNSDGKLKVDFKIMAPRGVVIREIETVNGSVTVSGFVNITMISAVNGSITARDLSGTADLSTVNGEVTADFDRLSTGGKISLDAVNGRINLLIPSDASATIRADSLNGNITNDFGLPVRKGQYVGRDLHGRLGSGDVQIRLNSINGALSIGRKNDGKSSAPATNLLPATNKDGENWENDPEALTRSGRVDRGFVKTMKMAEKESAKAAKAVVREMERVRPELERISVEAAVRVNPEISVKLKQQMLNTEKLQKGLMARIATADFTSPVPRVVKKSNSFAVKGTPTVTIKAKGASVTVRGWEKNEVQYSVTQFSPARDPQPLKITDGQNGSSVNIGVENPDAESRNGMFFNDSNRVRIEVYVPRRSDLKIDANGAIRLEGVTGDVELTGADETIDVRDIDGKLRIVNGDGRIRVVGFRGDISAVTVDGMINLEGEFQKLNARSGEGNIFVTLPVNTSADLDTNCREVTGEGIVLTPSRQKANCSRYKIGTGGASFAIATEGDVYIRGSGVLKEYQ